MKKRIYMINIILTPDDAHDNSKYYRSIVFTGCADKINILPLLSKICMMCNLYLMVNGAIT